ncbi:MAG: hypothetical protein HY908_35990 [Myxococcales bacterium]|nr:hypothetical protein [Myxococcales bacterium]
MRTAWIGIVLLALTATTGCSKGKRGKCESAFDMMKEMATAMAKAFLKDEADGSKKIAEMEADLDKGKKEFLDMCENLPDEAVACLEDPMKSAEDPKCVEVLGKLKLGAQRKGP